MSRLKENVPNCCEDHTGKELCKHLVGVHCNVSHPNGAYISITRDGLELLQRVGCASFRPRTSLKQTAEAPCHCDICLVQHCDFKNDMVGKPCQKFQGDTGVLSERNWT